jgi:hypothetical protein
MALARVRNAVFVPVGQVALTETAGEPPAQETAVSETPQTADPAWILAGYLLIGLGWLAGWGLWAWRDPAAFKGTADVTIFAPLYIFAQAIERLIEPFSSFLGAAKANGSEGLVSKNKALTNLYEAVKAGNAANIAGWQAALDKVRKNTAVIAWALASFLGMLASGAFGVFLVRAIGFDIPAEVDILVSGVAIGSGTKPLHDLISNLQKSKEQKENPKETGGTV